MAKVTIDLVSKKSKDWGWTKLARHLDCTVDDLRKDVKRMRPKSRRDAVILRLDRNEKGGKAQTAKGRGQAHDDGSALRTSVARTAYNI